MQDTSAEKSLRMLNHGNPLRDINGNLDNFGVAILVISQLEKAFGVLASDLRPIPGVHLGLVEPVASIIEMFKRVIHRE